MTVVASNFERRENDLYETEAWATRLLQKHVALHSFIWEPAAGNHKMARVLSEKARVVTSDITTYDVEHDFQFDFLGDDLPSTAVLDRVYGLRPADIVTNPPYGKGNRAAVEFARRALLRTDGNVALLLTAKFDSGNTRRDLFADNPRYAGKIVLLDRIQWFPGQHTGTEDHAWYIWRSKSQPSVPPRIFYGGKADL